MSTENFRDRKKCSALLINLQQNPGDPIYTLSPDKARSVLSGLQADSSVQKLPSDIENRNATGGPDGGDVAVEADVPVIAVRYHGTIHDFVMLNAIIDDPTPQAAIDQASFTLNKILANTNYKN